MLNRVFCIFLINGSRKKTAGYHITLRKISWPPPRLFTDASLMQEVTEITVGDAIKKETGVPHVGLCFGWGVVTSGTSVSMLTPSPATYVHGDLS